MFNNKNKSTNTTVRSEVGGLHSLRGLITVLKVHYIVLGKALQIKIMIKIMTK